MLRYFKLWLVLGWMLVLAVCLFSLIPNPPQIDIKFEYLDKLEHMLSYFVLMGWFAQLYQTKQGRLFYIVFFILLGILLEVLQGLGQTRLFEYTDMLANTTGVLMAWLMTQGKVNKLLLTIEARLFH